MKKFHGICIAVLVFVLALSFAACEAADGYSGMTGAPSVSDAAGDVADSDGDSEKGDGQQPVIKKELTAAEWNDIRNYGFWRSLFADGDEQNQAGVFRDYAGDERGLNTADMREITVTCAGAAVAGATVKLYKGDSLLYTAVTNAAGKAYVFGSFADSAEAASGGYSARVPLGDSTDTVSVVLGGCAEPENEIEIMFAVDTTGSMGDELTYLKTELEGVIRRVTSKSDAVIKLGLLFYRDESDGQSSYVTVAHDFADVTYQSELTAAIKKIAVQSAAGGGDYPEAVDRALGEAVGMGWSSAAKTKLLFHILDAPYHDTAQYRRNFATAVSTAAEKGIRIIPIAASGLDTLGQYIMRSAAVLTGGTYAFLTDDSGIGESHDAPATSGQYTVEYLSDLLVRLITGYHSGEFADAVHWSQAKSEI